MSTTSTSQASRHADLAIVAQHLTELRTSAQRRQRDPVLAAMAREKQEFTPNVSR
jgi:hypothetical protein